MVQLPDLRGGQERGGWGRAGDSQRAPSAPASDLGASPFGRRPQAPLSCDLRLNHAAKGMVQNACHSGDSSGPLDGSGVLQRLLPAAERRNFIAWRREPQGGAVGSESPILLTRTPNGGDSSTRAGP